MAEASLEDQSFSYPVYTPNHTFFHPPFFSKRELTISQQLKGY